MQSFIAKRNTNVLIFVLATERAAAWCTSLRGYLQLLTIKMIYLIGKFMLIMNVVKYVSLQNYSGSCLENLFSGKRILEEFNFPDISCRKVCPVTFTEAIAGKYSSNHFHMIATAFSEKGILGGSTYLLKGLSDSFNSTVLHWRTPYWEIHFH